MNPMDKNYAFSPSILRSKILKTIEHGKMALLPKAARSTDIHLAFIITMVMLEVEFIELKQLIMNLMFIAIWKLALMDIQVFYVYVNLKSS